jgi:hypothetical protein
MIETNKVLNPKKKDQRKKQEEKQAHQKQFSPAHQFCC